MYTEIQSKEKANHSLPSLLRRADEGDETELRLFKMLMADPAGTGGCHTSRTQHGRTSGPEGRRLA